MQQQPDDEQRLWRLHLVSCSKVWSKNGGEELLRHRVELNGVRKFVHGALGLGGR